MRAVLASAVLILGQQTAAAQVFVAGGFSRQSVVGFTYSGHHFRAGGFIGYGSAGGYPYLARPWGYYAAPPLLIVPLPIVIVPANYDLQGFGEPPLRPSDPTPPVNPAKWHVIRPVKEPAFPVVARPELIPAAPPAAVGERNANPKLESARQVRLAQTAFVSNEYGRALERMEEAIKAKPDEPLPYFLLAQVRFSRGEYTEAVSAICDGLKLAPDWPTTDFTPKPLYGANGVKYEEHFKELRVAARNRPDDVTLQFLLAYQLWFQGERGEATRIFRRLAPVVKEKNLVEAFLDVAVGRVVKK